MSESAVVQNLPAIENVFYSFSNRLHVLQAIATHSKGLNDFERSNLRALRDELSDFLGSARIGREELHESMNEAINGTKASDELGPALVQVQKSLAALEVIILNEKKEEAAVAETSKEEDKS